MNKWEFTIQELQNLMNQIARYPGSSYPISSSPSSPSISQPTSSPPIRRPERPKWYEFAPGEKCWTFSPDYKGVYEVAKTGWWWYKKFVVIYLLTDDYSPAPYKSKILTTVKTYQQGIDYVEVMWRFQQNGAFDPMGGSNGSA